MVVLVMVMTMMMIMIMLMMIDDDDDGDYLNGDDKVIRPSLKLLQWSKIKSTSIWGSIDKWYHHWREPQNIK